MKKIYTIKFFEKKDGQKPHELTICETYAYSNKEAFQAGRARLAKWAKMYINNFDGADDDSRLIDAEENLESLMSGSINTYYEDVYTYSFKVFSKKNKKEKLKINYNN